MRRREPCLSGNLPGIPSGSHTSSAAPLPFGTLHIARLTPQLAELEAIPWPDEV
jgi:hypothetical protein